MAGIRHGALVALAGFAGLLQGAMAPAQAHDEANKSPPLLSGDGYLEFRLDDVLQSDDTASQRLDSYLRGEANLTLHLTDEFSLQTRLTADSLRGPKPHRDRFIAGTGVFLEQLYANYETDAFRLYAGKIPAPFGIAWGRLPDLLKDGVAGDYELAEMIGAGGSMAFTLGDMGKHRLDAAAFFVDTSILHRSLFAAPDTGDDRAQRISHLRRSDGGPANTGKPNNFSATFGNELADDASGVFYQLGYRHLARGETEQYAEDAAIGALGYVWKVDPDVTLTPFVEAGRFWHFNGRNADATVVTAALQVQANPWSIDLAGSWRGIGKQDDGTPRRNDYAVGFQVGYALGGGFTIGAGYRHERLDGVNTDIVRSFLTYNFEFGKLSEE